MTTNPCYSGLVPSDMAVQNLDVAQSLRTRTAAIGKLCAGIDFSYRLLHGSATYDDRPGEGFSNHIFPSGFTIIQSAQSLSSLDKCFYVAEETDLSNFQFSILSSSETMTMSIEVSDASVDDPTSVSPLSGFSFDLTGLSNTTPTFAQSTLDSSVTIPAGTYITIHIETLESISTLNVTWSLEVRKHLP